MTDHPVKMQAELIKELNGLPPMCAIETAFQAGADQELEACCETLNRAGWANLAVDLRTVRRPKPPTLAEQALKALGRRLGPHYVQFLSAANQDAIRAALTRLAELEAQQ
jgi:hypothetical protein